MIGYSHRSPNQNYVIERSAEYLREVSSSDRFGFGLRAFALAIVR